MNNTFVRLNGLTIENFKNVKNGQLSFANPRKAYRTSVLGLYGQNGSGKINRHSPSLSITLPK